MIKLMTNNVVFLGFFMMALLLSGCGSSEVDHTQNGNAPLLKLHGKDQGECVEKVQADGRLLSLKKVTIDYADSDLDMAFVEYDIINMETGSRVEKDRIDYRGKTLNKSSGSILFSLDNIAISSTRSNIRILLTLVDEKENRSNSIGISCILNNNNSGFSTGGQPSQNTEQLTGQQ